MAKRITADGRDITKEEWRRIPGYKNYEITKDGDVWSRKRMMLLKESENRQTGAFSFNLYDDSGKNTSRNFQMLVDLAYPELAIKRPEKKNNKPPTYLSKEGWVDLPGFSRFQVHIEGAVRLKAQRHKVKTRVNSLSGETYVQLSADDGEKWVQRLIF